MEANLNTYVLVFEAVIDHRFLVHVPEEISKEEVMETIQKEHELLRDDFSDRGLYERYGYNGDTLLSHVSRKYGWPYESLEDDIVVKAAF